MTELSIAGKIGRVVTRNTEWQVKGEYDRIAPFDFFDATGSYVAWFYDQGRERFIYLNCPLDGDVMIELQDMSGAFNPNNVGMQMLWGGAFGSNYKLSNGRMVMEDDAGERWMLSLLRARLTNKLYLHLWRSFN